MRILFLGDVVGVSGCSKIMNNLLDQIEKNKIDSNKLSSVDNVEQSDYFPENSATISDQVDQTIVDQSNSQNNSENSDASYAATILNCLLLPI